MSGRAGDDAALALSAEASDHARSVATYANAAPSRRALRRGRLLSSNGYLDTVTFGFVSPNASHVSRGENRECTTIRLIPYGDAEDAALLTRTDAEGRSLVGPLDGSPGLVASRRVASDDKTAALVPRMVGPAGPAYHVVISRLGGVLVCASLDDVTDPAAPLAVDVAYESALAADESEWLGGPPGSFSELKMTAAQADSLAVTLAKLYVAYPSIARDPVVASNAGPSVTRLDFTGGDWRDWPAPQGPGATRATPAGAASVVGPFDLGAEVFERPGTAVPNTSRATMASAVTRADTLGQRSELLGNYARAAGADRARAMQAVSRREFYVQRVTSAQAQAGDAGAAAASAAATSPSGPRPVTNSGPWTYDFETGRWQDENLSPY
jgi:hypothetical protein